MTSKDTWSPAVLPWLRCSALWKRPAFAPLGLCLEQCSLQSAPPHIPEVYLGFQQFGFNVMSSRRLPYVTLSRPEEERASVSPHRSLLAVCALFYSHTLAVCFVLSALNSAGPLEGRRQATSIFCLLPAPTPVWLAGARVTQMAPRVHSSWKSE